MVTAGPFERPLGVANIVITAMIGIGRTATPTASGKRFPIACQNIVASPPTRSPQTSNLPARQASLDKTPLLHRCRSAQLGADIKR